MPRLRIVSITLGLILATAMPAFAQRGGTTADSVAVVATANALLRAISTRDAALARSVMRPDADFVAVGTTPTGNIQVAVTGSDTTLTVLASAKQRFHERMWQATALVTGDVALVSAPYDFHRDGTFSHCGTDTFTLVRSEGSWRITHVAYTVEREGCRPSPLGPIPADARP